MAQNLGLALDAIQRVSGASQLQAVALMGKMTRNTWHSYVRNQVEPRMSQLEIWVELGVNRAFFQDTRSPMLDVSLERFQENVKSTLERLAARKARRARSKSGEAEA
jgi:hypothetical protein